MKCTPMFSGFITPIISTINVEIDLITSILPKLLHLLHHLPDQSLMIFGPLILFPYLLCQYVLFFLHLPSKLLLLLHKSLKNIFHSCRMSFPGFASLCKSNQSNGGEEATGILGALIPKLQVTRKTHNTKKGSRWTAMENRRV